MSFAWRAPAADRASVPIFEFHNGFWINLHHFLYRESLAGAPGPASGRLKVTDSDARVSQGLSAQEKDTWDAAVSYYRDSLIRRDLLFDRGMESIKNELEDSESSPDLAKVGIPTELKTVLLKAAPIYQKYWWPTHEKQNQLWISQLQPLIQQYGDSILNALVTIYDKPWPQRPVRVDAVAYANWAGAYTTLEPTRPTISTTDPGNQGAAALEIVFHESSHGLMDKVMNGINSAERTVNSEREKNPFHFRRDLWHEVLFYTSGELVAEHILGYVPYADKNGLWKRAWPGADRTLIEADWKPHMMGRVSLASALTNLAEDLARAPQP